MTFQEACLPLAIIVLVIGIGIIVLSIKKQKLIPLGNKNIKLLDINYLLLYNLL